ncbi:hypothetical protein [Microbacterium thalassium]|uniref:Uncharacterized protein n=1 Tax=Microbacterium thalassium TaxID=362649 RepID=A0A7X0FPH4_9MICO|nr:hypothetical protein [Microbacterium thalassium]MBB6390686.1 hypothetical protein [Microbacterium thalassium]GLK25795.1 hypothetical protein GCM10017607_31140 [Microbacterium thalassium]
MNEELFLHLAEIAGVFVGFGALIAMRNGGAEDAFASYLLRALVTMGSFVIVLALLPVVLAQFGLSGRVLWLTCAITAVPLYAVLVFVVNRTPEPAFGKRHRTFSRVFISVGLPLHVLMLTSITLILIGAFPALDVALYTALVSVSLAFTVWGLLMLLYRPGEHADEQHVQALEDPTDAMR